MEEGIGYDEVWPVLYRVALCTTNRAILISTNFAPSLCITSICYTCKHIYATYLSIQRIDVRMSPAEAHIRTLRLFFEDHTHK